MTQERLERRQVWVYLAAILAGLGAGSLAGGAAGMLEALLWPALAALLYVTFTQVRLDRLAATFRDGRFTAAALVGNFALLPALVWGVVQIAPDDPAIRLGLLLVLLVPCTDWFVTFARQAGGDLRRAIAVTPALLVGQMLALPLYLRVFMGRDFPEFVPAGRMALVFAVVIALPLALAWATERWAARRADRTATVAGLGRLPVPLLALVLFLIAAAQVDSVLESLPVLRGVVLACLAFLAGATITGLALARAFRLPPAQARTLVFSLTTRNSFVVLPIALALPAAWQAAAIVIVFQSLIELFAMLALLLLVPRWLPPDQGGTTRHAG